MDSGRVHNRKVHQELAEMRKEHAYWSREFLKIHKIHRYRMKKIQDMDDDEVIGKCHCYCEENCLIEEWNRFRDKKEQCIL